MSRGVEQVETHLKNFERFSLNGSAHSPEWIRNLRQKAIARFAAQGFPTARDEEWRFTNVGPLAGFPSALARKSNVDEDQIEQVHGTACRGVHGTRLVFINGYHRPDLSTSVALPKGVIADGLCSAMTTSGELIEHHLGAYAPFDEKPFVALSTAFMRDGAFVYVPRETVVEAPIYLLYLFADREAGATAYPRNLVVVEREGQVVIIEHYVSLVGTPCFTNAVTEIVAGDHTTVEHIKIQDEHRQAFHVATIQSQVGSNGSFTSNNIAWGGKLSRNDVNVTLDGEGIDCTLNGLYVASGDQHMDNRTFLDHTKPRCNSHELYKGILGDEASGVFRGKIHVWEDAQKTDAKQTNKNLLLSDEATIDTMPQLEIFADDVKCTHGATVGQLEDEAIFYLRSRGIDRESARSILTHAFASDIISRISSEAVRQHLDAGLQSLLENSFRVEGGI
ncbi:MAG: Fe-S cluster assembly protein SufD [Armatimonadetes bacterium]|nr:Fe-S cluster assembly protein SufD [Armatimonadota bacterium]